MRRFGLWFIFGKWHVAQDMDHICFCHIRTIKVLVSQLHECAHRVLSFFKVFLIETIISICYRLDQFNCFRKEWSELRGWDVVAEFTEAVGNSVSHEFPFSVFRRENVKILLRELYKCGSLCRTASVLNEIAEVAE